VIRRVLFIASIPFLVTTLYCTWCLHRLAPTTLIRDKSFPRPWPYPDWLLIELNDYFDKLYPAPFGSIKMHGEIARVLASITLVTLVLIACGVTLAMPEIWRVFSSLFKRHEQQIESVFKIPGQKLRRLFRPRLGLRTLLIILAISPPVIAWVLYPWFTFNWIEVFAYYVGFKCVPVVMSLWFVTTCSAVVLKLAGY
jgi:hypothetical protein